jgi:hypothetical protein
MNMNGHSPPAFDPKLQPSDIIIWTVALGVAAKVLRKKRPVPNSREAPNVTADDPAKSMDRFREGLRRVLSVPKKTKRKQSKTA